MAELMFVEYCSTDKRGRRVITIDQNVTNYVFFVEELDNDKVNKICGLSTQDVIDIKAWLEGKNNNAKINDRQPDRLL